MIRRDLGPVFHGRIASWALPVPFIGVECGLLLSGSLNCLVFPPIIGMHIEPCEPVLSLLKAYVRFATPCKSRSISFERSRKPIHSESSPHRPPSLVLVKVSFSTHRGRRFVIAVMSLRRRTSGMLPSCLASLSAPTRLAVASFPNVPHSSPKARVGPLVLAGVPFTTQYIYIGAARFCDSMSSANVRGIGGSHYQCLPPASTPLVTLAVLLHRSLSFHVSPSLPIMPKRMSPPGCALRGMGVCCEGRVLVPCPPSPRAESLFLCLTRFAALFAHTDSHQP
jgi:hypothetical protein